MFLLENHSLPLRIAYRNAAHQPKEKPAAVAPQRFLFPLPYNDEQMAIARKLYEQDAVTVKGPPGTGKSHTIANLTSHYVAQGKSILIVSKNAKALEVIRGKLPGEVQHLAVSLVQDGQHLDQLKHSIDAIKDHLSRRYDWEKVCEMERELEVLDQQYQELLTELIQVVELNQASLSFYSPVSGKEELKSVAEWAQFLAENPHSPAIIQDSYQADLNEEVLTQSLLNYLKLSLNLDQESYALQPVSFTLSTEELPDSQAFQQALERRQRIGAAPSVLCIHHPQSSGP